MSLLLLGAGLGVDPSGGGSSVTFDPANKAAAISLGGGDLVATIGAADKGTVRSTVSSSGRFAVEFHLTGTLSPLCWVGAGNSSASMANGSWAASDAFRTGMYVDHHVWALGTNAAFDPTLATIVSGDYLLMEVDPLTTTDFNGNPAPNGVIRWKVNGTVSQSYKLPAGPFFALAGFDAGSGATITANYGATSFVNPTTYPGL